LLDGKDVLAKARTGSGKTGAYGVPMVQRILAAKEVSEGLTDLLDEDVYVC
jgi:ATP-dependent RNA helicase DDX56/DBP9